MQNAPAALAPWIVSILAALLSSALGIVAYFLKDLRRAIKEKDQQHDAAIAKLQDELSEFRARLPHQYVLRDDFVRAVAGLDHKLDIMGDQLHEVVKTLPQIVEMAKIRGGESR